MGQICFGILSFIRGDISAKKLCLQSYSVIDLRTFVSNLCKGRVCLVGGLTSQNYLNNPRTLVPRGSPEGLQKM